MSCSATDKAGNTNSASASYQVTYPGPASSQPVDNLPTLNSLKAGNAVPFKVTLGGNQGLNILRRATPYRSRFVQHESPGRDVEKKSSRP